MNELETIDIRTGRPFTGLQKARPHGSLDGASIEGGWGRARGLMGGAFMGAMLAQQGGAKLPYDAEVEYLESTNDKDSIVVPGITFTDASVIRIGFQQLSTQSNKMVASIRYDNNNVLNLLTYGATWRFGSASLWMRDRTQKLDYLDCTVSASGVSVNNVDYAWETSVSSEFAYTGPLYLFSYYNNGNAKRIYHFSVQGQLDMIPVRTTNANGVCEGVFFDRLSGMIYHNKAATQFVIGPDIT